MRTGKKKRFFEPLAALLGKCEFIGDMHASNVASQGCKQAGALLKSLLRLQQDCRKEMGGGNDLLDCLEEVRILLDKLSKGSPVTWEDIEYAYVARLEALYYCQNKACQANDLEAFLAYMKKPEASLANSLEMYEKNRGLVDADSKEGKSAMEDMERTRALLGIVRLETAQVEEDIKNREIKVVEVETGAKREGDDPKGERVPEPEPRPMPIASLGNGLQKNEEEGRGKIERELQEYKESQSLRINAELESHKTGQMALIGQEAGEFKAKAFLKAEAELQEFREAQVRAIDDELHRYKEERMLEINAEALQRKEELETGHRKRQEELRLEIQKKQNELQSETLRLEEIRREKEYLEAQIQKWKAREMQVGTREDEGDEPVPQGMHHANRLPNGLPAPEEAAPLILSDFADVRYIVKAGYQEGQMEISSYALDNIDQAVKNYRELDTPKKEIGIRIGTELLFLVKKAGSSSRLKLSEREKHLRRIRGEKKELVEYYEMKLMQRIQEGGEAVGTI